jgi:hypothetical protein
LFRRSNWYCSIYLLALSCSLLLPDMLLVVKWSSSSCGYEAGKGARLLSEAHLSPIHSYFYHLCPKCIRCFVSLAISQYLSFEIEVY